HDHALRYGIPVFMDNAAWLLLVAVVDHPALQKCKSTEHTCRQIMHPQGIGKKGRLICGVALIHSDSFRLQACRLKCQQHCPESISSEQAVKVTISTACHHTERCLQR